MNIVKRLFCWFYCVDPDELDRIAQARPRHEKWSDWAKRISGRR